MNTKADAHLASAGAASAFILSFTDIKKQMRYNHICGMRYQGIEPWTP